jgi:hypothetical protein
VIYLDKFDIPAPSNLSCAPLLPLESCTEDERDRGLNDKLTISIKADQHNEKIKTKFDKHTKCNG